MTNLADHTDVLGQRVRADERHPQRSSVGVVELTSLKIMYKRSLIFLLRCELVRPQQRENINIKTSVRPHSQL